MKQTLLFLLLCHAYGAIFAQNRLAESRQTSYFTFVYQISGEEARRFYEQKKLPSSNTLFYQKVDSFPTDSVFEKHLAPGHYLFAYVQKNRLFFELQTYGGPNLFLLNNKTDLSLILLDSLGNLVEDAQVKIKKRNIPFDAQSRTYRLQKSNRQGMLSVRHQGEVFYYNIERNHRNIKFYRFRRTLLYRTPLAIVAYPLRTLYRGGRDIVNSIRYRRPSGFIGKIANIFRGRDYRRERYRSYGGYIALNQAKYRPGDTLHYKMLLLYKRGKPIKKPVAMSIHRGRKTLLRQTLEPYRPGLYEGSVHLHDSLDLVQDDYYYLSFDELKEDGHAYMSEPFTVEDYELKENTYSLRPSQEEAYYIGEPISLFLEGKDASDRNLLDAQVEITLKSGSARNFQTAYSFIPDTLWTWKQALDPQGETKIIIPDSILPRAEIWMDVYAEFINSSNEFTDKSVNLYYRPYPERLRLYLDADSLVAEYKGSRDRPIQQAYLQYYRNNIPIAQKKITLPHKEAIKPFYEEVLVQAGTLRDHVYLEDEEKLFQPYAYRQADSVYISVYNPRNIPFWYTIYHHNHKICRGQATQLEFREKQRSKKKYYVSLQYVWNGRVEEEDYEVPLDRGRLHISFDHPRMVRPGQTTQMELSVQDYQGKPVAHADLAAYAMTQKFKAYEPPSLPDLRYDNRTRKFYNTFEVGRDLSLKKDVPLHWEFWNAEMQLDSLEYFRFLFPQDGFYHYSYPVEDTMSQFSPFVVEEGRIVPVLSLYLDKKPIFYHKSTTLPRYVFRTSPGYHHLRIRTAKREIVLDSLHLEKGKKLLFSVEPGRYSEVSVRVFEEEGLSIAEKNTIWPYLVPFAMERDQNLRYLYSPNRLEVLNLNPYEDFKNVSRRPMGMAGPFSDRNLIYEELDMYQQGFEAEPGFRYSFAENLLKLYSWTYDDYNNFPSSNYLFQPNFREEWKSKAYLDSLWKVYQSEKKNYTRKYKNPDLTYYGEGRLSFIWDASREDSLGLVENILVMKEDISDFIRIYPAKVSVIHQLKPGYYSLIFLRENGSYSKADSIQIQANGLNHYQLEGLSTFPPDSFSIKSRDLIQRQTYKLAEQEEELFEIKKSYNLQNAFMFNLTGSGWLSGTVSDAYDEVPLPGVSVIIKGTTIGTVTDMNGHYILDAPKGGTLIFSAIGYVTKEVQVGTQGRVNISLSEAVASLSEVIVVAYGEQKQKQVALLSSNSIIIRGASSLNGRLPGVQITDNTGSLAKNEAQDLSTSDQATDMGEDFLSAVPPSSLRQNFRDYAYWQPRLKTNSEGKASFPITFPDDLTTWNAFVLAYDQKGKGTGIIDHQITAIKDLVASVSLPRFLRVGDSSQVRAKVLNYLSDTVRVQTAFALDGETIGEQDREVITAVLDSLPIVAHGGQDSLKVSYFLRQADGYTDGEIRRLPVYPLGARESQGTFAILEGDTSLQLNTEPWKGPVQIHAQSNVLEVFLAEIDHIRRYRYLCNEQLASKVKALLAEESIRNMRGESFKYRRLLQKMLSRLQAKQNLDGSWAWWNQGSPGVPWISQHVMEALLQAQYAGYEVNAQSEKLSEYLVWELEKGNLSISKRLELLWAMLQWKAPVNYKKHLRQIERDSLWASADLRDQFEAIRIKQALGLPYSLDSLWKYKKETLLGSVYWGQESRSLFYNPVPLTLQAYQIIRKDSNHLHVLPRIRNYFLESRKAQGWRNTYESIQIMETLLADLVKESGGQEKARLQFTGALNQSVEEFPFTAQIQPGESLQIMKTGTYPVYFTAYQSYWNSQAEEVKGDFVIQTYWEDSLEVLQAGRPVQLKAQVEVKKWSEYVMIEIPIPAGCSYASQDRWPHYPELHREYLREKVSIFCAALAPGKYEFSVELVPRFPGKYHINPAQVSLMYFPTFFGRGKMTKMRIR